MRHIPKTLFSSIYCCLLTITSLAQTASFQDTIQKLDQLFAHYNTNTPGGSLTVSRNGQLLYHKAFGMADLEHNLANTTETIFEAGSVSKQLTATAILLLAQDGKLSLEDDVRKYVPELPDFGYKIRIRHLMTHTSGLRDWGSVAAIGGLGRGVRVHTHAHVLEILSRQKALNFPPGDQYSYCNSGYNLMAIIIDRLSGMPFAAFCKQRIFEPMGMKNTQWRDDYRKIVKNRAIAYEREDPVYLQNMPFEMVHGNGGLLTTTEDLMIWNQHYKTQVFGGKTFTDLQWTQAKLNNGVTISYAAGLFIDNYNDFKEISHSGATAGYRAWLAYYPAQELSIAFLSNDAGSNSGRVGAQVAAIFLGERRSEEPMLGTIVPDEASFQTKVGLYKNIRNDNIIQLEIKDKLLQFKYGGALQATKENIFYNKTERLEFSNDKFILYSPNGDSSTYVKKEAFQPTMKDLQAFVGNYYSEEAATTIAIQFKKDTLQTFIKPDIYSKLTPFYKNTFQNEWGESLEFQYDKKGKMIGFNFTTGRAWNIPFKRMNE